MATSPALRHDLAHRRSLLAAAFVVRTVRSFDRRPRPEVLLIVAGGHACWSLCSAESLDDRLCKPSTVPPII
jgi:hypothetical protein